MQWKTQLGNQIRSAREALRMSQKELAGHLDVSRQMVVRYESGKAAPTVDVLAEAARVLNAKFQVNGHRISFEQTKRRLAPRPVHRQLELPYEKPKRFGDAVVYITPRKGRILIRAEIPA